MGIAISWCTVPEPDGDSFLARLNLSDSGRRERFPESAIAVAHLDTGWRLAWFNADFCPFYDESRRREYSRYCEMLFCRVEEHCMASLAEFWADGTCKWKIAHEGIDGPRGIETFGDLPRGFEQIRKEMEAAQEREGGEGAEVDYLFEIPLLMAQSLTGFKHDESCPHIVNHEFKVMERATGPRRNLFTGLIRRK